MFDTLSAPEQVEYLRAVLPLSQFTEIEEEHEVYSEKLVDELLMAGKRNVKRELDSWPDNWTVLKEKILNSSDEQIFREFTYRELSYYESAMSNGALETNLHLLEIDTIQSDGGEEDLELVNRMDGQELSKFMSTSDVDEIRKAFSSAGNNIWDVLDYIPRMRFGEIEDSNHIYAEFWVKMSEDSKYHPRKGENITFPNIGKAFVRVHLDEEVVEIRERQLNEDHIDVVQSTIEDAFKNYLAFTGNDLQITDDDVRNFLDLDEFQKATAAEHSGQSISRWSSDEEVSDDHAYPEGRPHNSKNMSFDIDGVGRVSFQLSPANNSFRIFQKKLPPEVHRNTVEYIIEHLNG